MPDPLFGAAFFVGILGNLLARHIDPAAKSAAESIFSRLTAGTPNLPPNHDLERVCRASLRQALELMAQAMDLQVAQPQTLLEAVKNRFDAQGRWKPMIEWWHTEEKEWFTQFTDAISSDKALADFDLRWIKGASSLNDPLRSQHSPALEKQFGDALLAWTERHVQSGKRPIFFEQWVREGWPVAKDSPTVRISIFPAWCLFLQHHFKEDEKVQAILTADWLASIDERLRSLPLGSQELSAALQEPLAEQLRMLTELRDQVQQLASSHAGLDERTGRLFALVLEFRSEVGAGFSNLRSVLEQTHAIVVETHAVVRSSDQKLDTILAKLNEMMVAQEHPPAPPAAPSAGPVTKRIADSKLFASDGASRLEKLVGRSQEKGLLTRAWRDGETRVLSFVAWGGAGKTSIVLDWLTDHLKRHWQGVDAFFDWSFYSQGTRDQSSASSDTFFSAALRHFGLEAVADSARSAEEKAASLATAIKQQRTLLVLDGLEPLQHPRKPGQEEGRLKDNGIATLLRLLAQSPAPGLCIVTTRVPVIDLRRFHGSTVQEVLLNHLSVRHGAELLHLAGARFAGAASIDEDDHELLAAAKEVKGHAMTLQMLGGYLRSAQEGDILRRDRVDFEKAFADQLEGHTYNVMEAYEKWFQAEGPRGERQLAVLRMLGLFDRVADAQCIAALRRDGGISGVSDAVATATLSDTDWQETLTHLSDHRLLSINRDTHDLDAHPLLREYFARQLREQQPDAGRAAHRRLYENLCATTKESHQPTVEDLQPLFQAIPHGCNAGQFQEVLESVYKRRILREDGQRTPFYAPRFLGLWGQTLEAVGAFFERQWTVPRRELNSDAKGFVLQQAGWLLRPKGRLQESVDASTAAIHLLEQGEGLPLVSVTARNLSQTYETLGELEKALQAIDLSVNSAERSALRAEDKLKNLSRRGGILHNLGKLNDAERAFQACLELDSKVTSSWDSMRASYQCFLYCDFLIQVGRLHEAEVLAKQAQNIAPDSRSAPPLAIGLWNLTLGMVGLQSITKGQVDEQKLFQTEEFSRHAVTHLRANGETHQLPRALLIRAWLRFLDGKPTGPESAQEDLDEAWEIAERGPMRLFMADIHLYRARLFGRPSVEASGSVGRPATAPVRPATAPYPWESPEADLAAARELIIKCGYGRRLPELEDAEASLLNASDKRN